MIHDDIKGKGKYTYSKPIVPSYTTFTHEHNKQSPPLEDLHDMYIIGYTMITKQGFKCLGPILMSC